MNAHTPALHPYDVAKIAHLEHRMEMIFDAYELSEKYPDDQRLRGDFIAQIDGYLDWARHLKGCGLI